MANRFVLLHSHPCAPTRDTTQVYEQSDSARGIREAPDRSQG